MLEVVEDHEHVGEHQREVREPEAIGIGRAERLDAAHEVVAEDPDRAAGERRQIGQRRLREASHLGRSERVGIAGSPSDQRTTRRGRKPMNE